MSATDEVHNLENCLAVFLDQAASIKGFEQSRSDLLLMARKARQSAKFIEKQAAEISELTESLNLAVKQGNLSDEQNSIVRTKLSEAEKDSRRIEWMQAKDADVHCNADRTWSIWATGAHVSGCKTLRELIDAVMAARDATE